MKIFPFLLLISFSCSHRSPYIYKSANHTEENKYQIVDINDILKNPRRYNEKNISVKGFFRYGFEMSAIFESPRFTASTEGYDAIWLTCDSLSSDENESFLKLDKRMAIIKGKYSMGGKTGHLAAFIGEIKVDFLETNKGDYH